MTDPTNILVLKKEAIEFFEKGKIEEWFSKIGANVQILADVAESIVEEDGKYYLHEDKAEIVKKISRHILENLDRNNAKAHFNLGEIYYYKNRMKEAIGEFEEVLRIDPNNVVAHYSLAVCYREIGDYENSLREYRIRAMYPYEDRLKKYDKLRKELGALKKMDKADLKKVLDEIRRINGTIYPNYKNIFDNFDKIKNVLSDLWVAEKISDKNVVEIFEKLRDTGATPGLVSNILFLKDSNRYNICTSLLMKSLEKIGKFQYDISRNLGENYLLFNSAVNKLKDENKIQPENIDWLLTVSYHLKATPEMWARAHPNDNMPTNFGVYPQIEKLLLNMNQIIFHGPPGTGKTFHAREFAKYFLKGTNENEFRKLMADGFVEFITFHPSYSYEEFVEGIRAERTPEGEVNYDVKDGIFKRICDRALENRDSKYLLVIDEINRGNISKIFGELITLLEKDKRKGSKNEIVVNLPYSGKKFTVPPNLYIIGTMNTADRSIALIDVALRRRFGFWEFGIDYEALRRELGFANQDTVIKKAEEGDIVALSILALEKINKRIIEIEKIGKNKQIGHACLMDIKTEKKTESLDERAMMIWRHKILPLLEEYFYGRYDEIAEILCDRNGQLIDKETRSIRDFKIEDLRAVLVNLRNSG